MKKKRLMLLAAVLLVCLGGYGALRVHNGNRTDQETEEAQAADEVLSVPAESVAKAVLGLDGNSYEFVKTDGTWNYTGDKNFPVDSDKLESLLELFERVEAVRTLKDVTDLSEYGLSEPAASIRLTDGDEKEYALFIGNLNSSTGDYYVYTEDETTVYTIDSTIPMSFQLGLYDLAKTESFPSIDSSEVNAVEVQTGDAVFEAALEAGSSTAWMVGDGLEEYEGDEEKLLSLLDSLGSITYVSCLEYDCQNPAAYGLEEPAALLKVDYTPVSENTGSSEASTGSEASSESGSPEGEALSSNGGTEVLFAVGGTDEEGNYYVRKLGSGEVHTVSAGLLQPFLDARAEDYRSLALANMTMDETAKLTLSYDGTAYEFVQTETKEQSEDGEETVTYRCTRNHAEFDTDTYQSFFRIATGMKAQSFTGEEPQGEAACSMSFEKNSGQVRTVAYYPYDDNFYLAVADGKEHSLVNKMDVATLLEYIETVVK